MRDVGVVWDPTNPLVGVVVAEDGVEVHDWWGEAGWARQGDAVWRFVDPASLPKFAARRGGVTYKNTGGE